MVSPLAQDPHDDQDFSLSLKGPGSEQPLQPVLEPADEIFTFQHIPHCKSQKNTHRQISRTLNALDLSVSTLSSFGR